MQSHKYTHVALLMWKEREYEKDKYSSEQWAFIWKITPAISMMDDGETGKAAWEGFLDWVIETYFPEFACK